MTTSLLDADSLLAIDVGQINTRAMLFDVVDGHYRFLAVGTAPTTLGAPFKDIGEGVRLALDNLHNVTGRTLIGSDERLIMPTKADGSGVDTCVATISAGPPVTVVAIGLLEDISVESARHVAATNYARLIETFSLNDRRKPEARIDAILHLRPDAMIVAGGTDDGATASVMQLVESVGLACYLFPKAQRPEVLFAGNQALFDEIHESLGPVTNLHVAPNIRPTLDQEQIDPARVEFDRIFRAVRCRKVPGAQELDSWTGDQMTSTATAFGRVVSFLSKVYDPAKGVLGVDVGCSATTVAAAFSGELSLGVYPDLGLGAGLTGLTKRVSLEEISRWLSVEAPGDTLRDYLANKALYPAAIPASAEDQVIESALTRAVIRKALHLASADFPASANRPAPGLLPWFEPVVSAGSVLARAPSYGQALLILLDAIQPTGISTLVLDQNNLSPALGAAASINPILVVQVLESRTFLSLGTVISPVSSARPGTPILRLKMTYASGDEADLDVKQGALEVLPLPLGQVARLRLQSLHRADVGMGGAGRSGNVRVTGGVLGLVIDARGRPLRLPEDAGRRRENFKKWLWTLGG